MGLDIRQTWPLREEKDYCRQASENELEEESTEKDCARRLTQKCRKISIVSCSGSHSTHEIRSN